MGAGKTTIGNLLAEKLNLIFFDIDSELEKIMGLTIKEIFDLYSKERFRLLESTLFDNMTKKDYFVYSTGGGIVEDNNNQKILKTRGISIFLDCSVKTLKSRLLNKTKHRPLLNNDLGEQIEKLYKKRSLLYSSCSHMKINTDNLSAVQTVKKIIQDIE